MVRFAEDMAEQSHTRPPIYLYTDGAASGNPGPGGYGIVLKCAGISKELSGGFRLTTNNRMELLAVIIGLESIRWTNAEVHVVSDSSYVVKAINEGWLEKWERKGFAKVKNPDLWMRFLPLWPDTPKTSAATPWRSRRVRVRWNAEKACRPIPAMSRASNRAQTPFFSLTNARRK